MTRGGATSPGDGTAPGKTGASVTTTAQPFAIEFQPPPPEIARYVTAFFNVRCDLPHISDVLPATLAILMVFVKGSARLQLPDGTSFASERTSLVTPLPQAASFIADAPWSAFGATITPLGWAALARGASARDWGNRVVEAGSLLGDAFTRLGDRLVQDQANGTLDLAKMVTMTGQVIATNALPAQPRHVEAIMALADWLGGALSPQLEDLAGRTAYSSRQMQRLAERYYGLAPKQLARKYRALRAAALLGDPATHADLATHVAEQFYDQSHMTRELRLFTGSTPGRLSMLNRPVMAASLEWGAYYQITAMPGDLRKPVAHAATLPDRTARPR